MLVVPDASSRVTVTPGSTHSLPSKTALWLRSNHTIPRTLPLVLPSVGSEMATSGSVLDVVDVDVVAVDVAVVLVVGATVDDVVVVLAAVVVLVVDAGAAVVD